MLQWYVQITQSQRFVSLVSSFFFFFISTNVAKVAYYERINIHVYRCRILVRNSLQDLARVLVKCFARSFEREFEHLDFFVKSIAIDSGFLRDASRGRLPARRLTHCVHCENIKCRPGGQPLIVELATSHRCASRPLSRHYSS